MPHKRPSSSRANKANALGLTLGREDNKGNEGAVSDKAAAKRFDKYAIEFFSDSSASASEESASERFGGRQRRKTANGRRSALRTEQRSHSLDSSQPVWNNSVIPFLSGYQCPDPFADSPLLRRASRLSILDTPVSPLTSLTASPIKESKQQHASPIVRAPSRAPSTPKGLASPMVKLGDSPSTKRTPLLTPPISPTMTFAASMDRVATPERVKAQIRAKLLRHTLDDHYDKDDEHKKSEPPKAEVTNPYVKESRVPIGPASHNKRSDLYKTVMCRNWQESGECRYGVRCQFAHGEDERQKYRQLAKESKEAKRAEGAQGSPSAGRSVRMSQSVSSLASTSSSLSSTARHHHHRGGRRNTNATISSSASTTSGSDLSPTTPFTTPGTRSLHAVLPEEEQQPSPTSRKPEQVQQQLSPIHHPSPRKAMTQFLLDRIGDRALDEDDDDAGTDDDQARPLKGAHKATEENKTPWNTPASQRAPALRASSSSSPWYPWPSPARR